jgi:hypothetical protein
MGDGPHPPAPTCGSVQASGWGTLWGVWRQVACRSPGRWWVLEKCKARVGGAKHRKPEMGNRHQSKPNLLPGGLAADGRLPGVEQGLIPL